MRRGSGGRISGSRLDGFDDVGVQFELFSLDEDGNAVPSETSVIPTLAFANNNLTINEVTSYTFQDVIEDFALRVTPSGINDFDFDFAPNEESTVVEASSLNLTARYLPEGSVITLGDGAPIFSTFDRNEDGILNDVLVATDDRIEFVITGSDLAEQGVAEIAFAINDADNLRLGGTPLSRIDQVLQILGQEVTGIGGFSSILPLDIDDDGREERVRFRTEFIQVEGELFPIFELFENGVEREFITYTDNFGNSSLVQLEGEFGNEVFRSPLNSSIIDTEGRFIQADVIEFPSVVGQELLQIEGDFLDIGGDVVEIEGDIGEEFIILDGETIVLNDENSFPPFEFFSVRTFSGDIETGGEFVLDTEEERTDAVSNLEEIINLIGSSSNLRISGGYSEDPDIIVGNESNPFFNELPDSTEEEIEEPTTTLIEAENLTLDTYLVEGLSIGGQVISLIDATGDVGTATLDVEEFSIEPGTYNLLLSVFDENDGEAQIEVLVNDELVGRPIILNEDTSSGFAVEDVRRDYIIDNVELGASDVITIQGTADGTEWARVDYIDFIPLVSDS